LAQQQAGIEHAEDGYQRAPRDQLQAFQVRRRCLAQQQAVFEMWKKDILQGETRGQIDLQTFMSEAGALLSSRQVLNKWEMDILQGMVRDTVELQALHVRSKCLAEQQAGIEHVED
jgi:hypothetical protein